MSKRRLEIVRLILALCALLAAPALARAEGAPAGAASTPVTFPGANPWWAIAELMARVHDTPVRGPEIQPWVLSPGEQTRALEFRGAVPNPFHAETAIRFTLPVSARVSLRVYDVTGKLTRTLVDAQLPPGDHSAMLTASELRSGVYFAVLRVGSLTVSRSVVLAR